MTHEEILQKFAQSIIELNDADYDLEVYLKTWETFDEQTKTTLKQNIVNVITAQRAVLLELETDISNIE